MGTATHGSIGAGPGRGGRGGGSRGRAGRSGGADRGGYGRRAGAAGRRVPPGYAAAGALILLHGAGSLVHWDGPGAPADPGSALPGVIGDAALALAAGIAAVACGIRAFLLIRHYRAGCYRCYSWILAGLSCLAAAVGNGVWAWYELVWGATPPPASLADWAFLFFGPLALAALLAAHGDQVGALARVRLVLDTVLAAGSLFVVAWAVALAISVERVRSPMRTFLVLGYPAFDLVLVSLLLALRGRPARERGGIGTGVRIGYLVIVCCDSVFDLPSVHATYQSGGLLDTGWFAGYLLIAAAATTGDCAGAAAAEAVVPDSRLRRRLRIVRVIAPYAAACVCLTGVLADGLDRRSDPVVLFAGTAVLVALVVRQGITLVENQRLTAELRGAADTLKHHAYHDPLTGLANRALLTDRLEHALAQRAAEWEPVAVMFLDLDGFKAVNDSAGHETGDRVLVEAARRIGRTLRAGDTIARFGGDEFVVVLQTGTGPDGALQQRPAITGRPGRGLLGGRPRAAYRGEHRSGVRRARRRGGGSAAPGGRGDVHREDRRKGPCALRTFVRHLAYSAWRDHGDHCLTQPTPGREGYGHDDCEVDSRTRQARGLIQTIPPRLPSLPQGRRGFFVWRIDEEKDLSCHD